MTPIRPFVLASSLTLLCAFGAPTHAHDIKPFDLQKSTDDAELIFRGQVVDIAHRLSDVTSKNHVALPHTFVTYAIDEVVKGDYQEDHITLRFLGGFDPTTNRYMTVDGVPNHFNLDDEDVLFVRGNGSRACPLQGCEAGRFRIIGQKTYSHHGRDIFLSARDRISFGTVAPPEDYARMRTLEIDDPVRPGVLKRQNDSVQRGALKKRDTSKLGWQLNASELLDVIVDRASKSPKKAGPAAVSSADIDRLFTVRNPRASRPLAPRSQKAAPRARTFDDEAEEQILKAQGGDPVVR
ncbi:MAG: hypothetical protein AAF493_20285 [Pseudomonadota bacterium]